MTRMVITLLFATTVLASPSGAGVTDFPDDSFLWNDFQAIQVVDSFAIAASDFGLATLKLNPTTGHFDPLSHLLLNTQPVALKVVDYIALVRSTAGLTYLVDLSELPQLHLLGELDMGSAAYDLALAGHDLYIAAGFQGLRRYRLTDYGSPEFIDSSLAGVHCIQVEVEGDDLLVLDDYNAVLRYDLTESTELSPIDFLWLPRRAQGFFNIRDTLVIPVVDRPFLYRGLLSPTESRLLDSTVLGLVPERVYAIDTFLVAVDTYHNLMEVVSTEGNGHNLYGIDSDQGLLPNGCVYYEDSIPHLLMISDLNSLVSFNLEKMWFNPEPRNAYNRPGPVTTLAFHDGRLFTGGEDNPIESYRIDANGHAVLDTALYGLNDVGSVIPAGDVILAHFPSAGRLSAIQFDSGSIETISSLNVANQDIRAIKYDPFDQVDSLSMALAIYRNQVNIINISDNWDMTMGAVAVSTGETILDVIVIDSFLFVTTDDPQMHIYIINNALGLAYWWGFGVPGPINHMVVVEENEADDGSWGYPRTTLAFSGNQMYEMVFRPEVVTKPVVFQYLGQLPVDVVATAQGGRFLFTIGEQGVGVIDMAQIPPTMIEYGGYSGHLIAYGDSTLATSNGSAVHLYQYGTATVPEPEGDIILASTTVYLKPNYPNPFNPVTRIDFDLPQSNEVDVSIYNLLGRKVISLLNGPVEAGLHSVEWNGTDGSGRRVASGVYFYRLTTPTLSETRKMVLLK